MTQRAKAVLRAAVAAAQEPRAGASLSAVGLAMAGPDPRGFSVPRGARLTEAGASLPVAYLVTEGLVAMLGRSPAGDSAETGLVGPGGLVGHQAALGAATAGGDAIALTPVRGLLIDLVRLSRLARENTEIQERLFAYSAARLAETERLCVCAAAHSIEQRAARWLLSAAALVADGPVEITHQQFATLLGVRRASVTVCLHMLEGDRAIRCRRGQIEIRDVARLTAASCGCHAPD